jgi:gamma-glutamylcyclotransferase (GGCT)/AIG2-like uncharacterized protein YtfP
MNKGWIKLHRKLLNSDMYRSLNSKQRDVMLICLLLANHKGKDWIWKGELHKCQAGQFITSLDELTKLTAKDVTSQNIRTCLLKLETWNFLTNKSTNKNRLITICNWAAYQDDEKETNKQLTSNQQTTNKQLTNKLTPNKNVKNIKEVITPEEIHPLQQKIIDDFPRIQKLERQLTFKEALSISSKYDKEFVFDILERMDNYKDLLKKNTRVSSTIHNWCRMQLERNNGAIKRSS